MSSRFWDLFHPMPQWVAGIAFGLAIVSYAGYAWAQLGDMQLGDMKVAAKESFEKGLSAAQQQDGLPAPQQDRKQTLIYFLEALKADPDAPLIWYQLGLTLSKMPGYQAPASVWLDAYLLAVPNAPNAAAIHEKSRQLRAASEPRTEEKLLDQLDAIALDTRGALHAKQGQRELAIADFTQVIKLDPTQDRAREALKRLSVAPKSPEKPGAPASTGNPRQSTSRPGPKDTGCMRIVGIWNWAFGARATFKRDGTFRMQARTGESIGKWTCSDGRRYVLRHKNTTRMTMGEDGNTMTGVSSATGFLVRFTVHRRG
ncbi:MULTISPECIES: tetratricopeptide repeat protein [unclassified Bradyrhizobium]|uniref:tetratricopeptide repeat protein n=1 Tax=unclassified Bradyrhizobium TaxID=2631580 RepID=UPI00291687C6|nr:MULTISPECIES: tetratricopeptide repeat protein [unclassified Bradyrhizobium]